MTSYAWYMDNHTLYWIYILCNNFLPEYAQSFNFAKGAEICLAKVKVFIYSLKFLFSEVNFQIGPGDSNIFLTEKLSFPNSA